MKTGRARIYLSEVREIDPRPIRGNYTLERRQSRNRKVETGHEHA